MVVHDMLYKPVGSFGSVRHDPLTLHMDSSGGVKESDGKFALDSCREKAKAEKGLLSGAITVNSWRDLL